MSNAVRKPLWTTFLRFLAPLMLSNALQSLFGTVSNVYLGQMIGVDALAAVSVFFPVMFFLFAFVMGLSTGATVLIGQAHGAGEQGRIKIIVGTTLAVGLLLSISIALIGGIFSRQLMMMLATPPDILDQASAYARIMLLTMPLGFVFLLMTAMIRGVGDALTPLLALALSTAIGLILTPMLIRGSSRIARGRHHQPGLGGGDRQRADADRAGRLSAAEETCVGAGRCVAASSAAQSCGAGTNPRHWTAERDRHGGDGDRRAGAARPRQRLSARTPPPPMARSTR